MRVVVAMTGATGAVYGVRLLAALAELGVERHLILSRWAEVTLLKETGLSARDVGDLASEVHARDNQGAVLASGSFRHDGMIVAPCSMRTLSAIRYGAADSLIVRAADVTLKERRLRAPGARNAAERYPSREYAGFEQDGGHHRAAHARLL